MAKTNFVELPDGTAVPILFEDRSILAIDKPAGWMLGPEDEEHARRNLHLGLMAGIEEGSWWAKCRSLRFIRFIHRLDAPTTGVLLMAKSPGAIAPFGRLFATRDVSKRYLAITEGVPRLRDWTCTLPLGPDPREPGRHRVDPRDGKEAETGFRVLDVRSGRALIEAFPRSGRTHQIRLHLAVSHCPVVGDILYGRHDPVGLGLRAVDLSYRDPFTGRPVHVRAPFEAFKSAFGFGPVPPALAHPLDAGSPDASLTLASAGSGTEMADEKGEPRTATPLDSARTDAEAAARARGHARRGPTSRPAASRPFRRGPRGR